MKKLFGYYRLIENTKNKKRSTFIQFDIIEFYPSITKESLQKSPSHTKEYTDITDQETEIILSSGKSILSDNRRIKVKSHVNNFDGPMGAYDAARVADLIKIHILDIFSGIVNLGQVGL